MARAAITFPVLVGLLLTTTSTVALGESTNPLPHNGICRRQYLVAATSTDTGTLLYLSTSEPNNFTLEISDRFLPTQCGENYELCDVLLIEMESEVIVFVPSQGGFVMVTYRVSELPHDIFHPVTENCHPVKAFLNSEHNLIVIVCVELSSDTNGSLFIFEFSLSRMTLRCSERFVLHNSRTLSEAVHASNRIFFTENDELLVAESEASSSLEPGFLININNCTRTNQIDVTGNEVSIYCTQNDDSWTVVANSHFSTHHTYSRYPCPGLNQYVRVENKRQIMFGNTTQQPLVGELPDDIAYAACLGSEDSFVFWAFTENGRLVSVPLTTENHTKTNLSECTTEGDNCLRPSFDARKTSGAYFNHETNQVHITNITSLCGHRTVNMFGTPQLLRITLGDKEDSCSCANELPTTLPTSLPTTLPTSLPSSVSLTLSILFSVVCILLIITAIIIIILCCREIQVFLQRCEKKEQPFSKKFCSARGLHSSLRVRTLGQCE
ncbi:uncharacterized protein LOC135351063 isoform X2 [Halichondria panicea]|uniref:uncharacterized protein LOC135351063 isoform X2 n=1 Tax=Halichondria panicea TaxID=6063 RepID=UPI00312B724E